MTHPTALQELLSTIECGEAYDTYADHLAAIKQAAKAVQVMQVAPPLRDWFAGQMAPVMFKQLCETGEMNKTQMRELCEDAYSYADAMLKAREAKP